MPRNESKNKFIMVNKMHFLCKFHIQPHLETVEYGRSIEISKCQDQIEMLPPILAHVLPYRPSTKQMLC